MMNKRQRQFADAQAAALIQDHETVWWIIAQLMLRAS